MPSSPYAEAGGSQVLRGPDKDTYGLHALREQHAGSVPTMDTALDMQPRTNSGAYNSVVATQRTAPDHSNASGTVWNSLDGDDASVSQSQYLKAS